MHQRLASGILFSTRKEKALSCVTHENVVHRELLAGMVNDLYWRVNRIFISTSSDCIYSNLHILLEVWKKNHYFKSCLLCNGCTSKQQYTQWHLMSHIPHILLVFISKDAVTMCILPNILHTLCTHIFVIELSWVWCRNMAKRGTISKREFGQHFIWSLNIYSTSQVSSEFPIRV